MTILEPVMPTTSTYPMDRTIGRLSLRFTYCFYGFVVPSFSVVFVSDDHTKYGNFSSDLVSNYHPVTLHPLNKFADVCLRADTRPISDRWSLGASVGDGWPALDIFSLNTKN